MLGTSYDAQLVLRTSIGRWHCVVQHMQLDESCIYITAAAVALYLML